MMLLLYVLSNNLATFAAQFMKKLINTEAGLKKKTLLIKKACRHIHSEDFINAWLLSPYKSC